jgi:hypothetical protein
MAKKKSSSENPVDAIIFAASTYKKLEDVGVLPTPKNMALYRKIKKENEAIRNSGQGVVLPN